MSNNHVIFYVKWILLTITTYTNCNTIGPKIFQAILGKKLKAIDINIYIQMVTIPTLCRDCKHTITQYSQCY